MKNKKGKENYLLIIIIIILLVLFVAYLIFRNKKEEFSFIFSVNSLELKLNESYQIPYVLSNDSVITWKSSDEKVASVDKNGIVSAKGLGATIIEGSTTINDKKIVNSCFVEVYMGEKNVLIQDISVLEGELFISKGDTYNLEYNYVPSNGYVKSIEYFVDDTNIVSFDGKISAINVGSTTIRIVINNSINKEIVVNVIDESISPVFSKKIENVTIKEDKVNLKVNEEKEITYEVFPADSFISMVKWDSSNTNIIEVDEGKIKAKSPGEAKVFLTINDIIKEIDVTVLVPVTGIKLTSNEKIIIKEGKTTKVSGIVLPSNASNKKIIYRSSNPSSLSIDEYGNVKALKKGNGIITLETEDNNKTISVPFTVNPKIGVVNGDGGIWGYTNSKVQVPTRAGIDFFRNLANRGIGTLNGNVYTYSDTTNNYSYDVNTSTLKTDTKNILMRIYYPNGVDLSSVNTLTFFGGMGEGNFGGYFSTLDKNTEYLKSSGITILVSVKNTSYGYKTEDGIISTNFVKSIVKQKQGMRNSVAGYSMSGPQAAQAAETGNYDRLMIFDSYFNNPASKIKLKNFDIVFYSPVGDSMYKNTLPCLERMKNAGYTDVTVVTNNNELINKFSNSFLIVNPGNSLGKGHLAVNITNSNFFAYGSK